MEENVLKALINSREILRKKFNSIKFGEMETQQRLTKSLQPVIDPLKEIIKLSHEKSKTTKTKKFRRRNLKENIPRVKFKYEDDDNGLTLKKNVVDKAESGSEEEQEDLSQSDEDEFFSGDEDGDTIDLSVLESNKKLDTTHGLHKNGDSIWKFGNSNLQLSNDKIIIGNHKWALTPGLFELLFHKHPKNYDTFELGIYKTT